MRIKFVRFICHRRSSFRGGKNKTPGRWGHFYRPWFFLVLVERCPALEGDCPKPSLIAETIMYRIAHFRLPCRGFFRYLMSVKGYLPKFFLGLRRQWQLSCTRSSAKAIAAVSRAGDALISKDSGFWSILRRQKSGPMLAGFRAPRA